MKKMKKRNTKLFIALGYVTIIVTVISLILVGKLGKSISQPKDEKKMAYDKALADSQKMKGTMNIALFGVDSREDDLERSNSDSMMILSLNFDKNTAKVMSVYRDTYLNTWEESYRKCNAAYMKGGPQQSVAMLNDNLDLAISDYISVDFKALATLIDDVGGIDIDMTKEEAHYTNDYCHETSQLVGADYEELPEEEGTYHVNGAQAVSFCRIRYTAGNDMKRTERQRDVLEKATSKLMGASTAKIYRIMDDILPMVKTTLSGMDIIKIGMAASDMTLDHSKGFPFNYEPKTLAKKGAILVPADLENNVKELHAYLYDDSDYQVSDKVKEISGKIERETGVVCKEK